ncbi:MAG: ABC transporter ATP-binding protein [Azospirillum sp.]|nr:ABC transporter ATP-binding protein [Azospirillum sp.]
MNDWAINVKNLTKKFGNKSVVNNIDLQVPKGKIYGFLGPNGSGKTTTIRMLCGLLTPDGGEGTCLGFDILKQSKIIRKKVGYMTQKFSFWEDLTIRENLEFTAQIYGLDNIKERTNQTLEKLGLTNRAEQLAGTLSGGWKQRLALAACILHEPEILLLDEPTAGVDPKARREFWDELNRLSDSGITILVSTHYMDEAERCHKIIYIAYGNIMAQGSVDFVIKNAALHTLELEGKNLNELQQQLSNIPNIITMALFGEKLHICGTDGNYLQKQLEPILKKYKISCRETETSLEDAFIYYLKQAGEN